MGARNYSRDAFHRGPFRKRAFQSGLFLCAKFTIGSKGIYDSFCGLKCALSNRIDETISFYFRIAKKIGMPFTF